MKKYIFALFITSMIVLTSITVYAYKFLTMEKSEVEYRTYKDRLNLTEIHLHNERKTFAEKLVPKEGYHIYKVDEVRITYNKKGFGWVTQIDTLKTFAIQEYCQNH